MVCNCIAAARTQESAKFWNLWNMEIAAIGFWSSWTGRSILAWFIAAACISWVDRPCWKIIKRLYICCLFNCLHLNIHLIYSEEGLIKWKLTAALWLSSPTGILNFFRVVTVHPPSTLSFRNWNSISLKMILDAKVYSTLKPILDECSSPRADSPQGSNC